MALTPPPALWKTQLKVYPSVGSWGWKSERSDTTFQRGKGYTKRDEKRNERQKENKDAPLFCSKAQIFLLGPNPNFWGDFKRLQWAANITWARPVIHAKTTLRRHPHTRASFSQEPVLTQTEELPKISQV